MDKYLKAFSNNIEEKNDFFYGAGSIFSLDGNYFDKVNIFDRLSEIRKSIKPLESNWSAVGKQFNDALVYALKENKNSLIIGNTARKATKKCIIPKGALIAKNQKIQIKRVIGL